MIEPIPQLLERLYDPDSLIYYSDTEFYYNKEFDKDLLKDIQSHNFQIYNGDYRYSEDWNSPKIYLVGRGRNCGKKIFKVEGFLPYCYIDNDKGEFKTHLGNRVTKVILKTAPKVVADLRKLRERMGSLVPYEADILFVRRFLCDTYDFFKPTEFVEPKICIYDVETNFPANNNMISFSINGYDGFLYHCSKYQEPNKYSLILDAYTKLVEYDIVANWNIEFDLKKLQGDLLPFEIALEPMRMGYTLSKPEYIKKLSVDYNRFSVNIATSILDALIEFDFLKHEDGVLKPGSRDLDNRLYFYMTPIDLIPLAKKMHGKEIPGRWNLDNAGYRLCGCGKYPTSTRYVKDLSEEELFWYNTIDVIVPEVIDTTTGAIACHTILAWSLQSQIPEMELTAVVNDIALLREYHKDGIVLPSRPPWKRNKSKTGEYAYKAAEPEAVPGVYDNVVAYDLHAAYPTAVLAVNASCESKDPEGIHEAPNGVRFNDNYSTFIRALKHLLDDRETVKNNLKTFPKGSSEWMINKNIDFALKTEVAALSHGMFGWANSRTKDFEVADAITATVRGVLDTIKEFVDSVGCKWVYCHTDSVYVNAPKQSAEKLLVKINDTIKKYCSDKGYTLIPRLDYKGFYPKAYIHSPARNVLVDEDGEWHTTGMNYMRSEVPEPLANIEIQLIADKLKGASIEELLTKLRGLVYELQNVDSIDLGIIKPLTKPISQYGRKLQDGTKGGVPYHINALVRANKEYGFKIKKGEKFRVLPVITDELTGVKVIRRKVVYMAYPIDEDLPEMFEVDYQQYLKSNLWGKICNLVDLTPKQLEKEIMNDIMRDRMYKEVSKDGK